MQKQATPLIAGLVRRLDPDPDHSVGSDLIDPAPAAEILGLSVGTLSVWRSTGRYRLPFVKVGRRVKYSRKAIEAWLESRTRANGATD
jgi:excisionase family DNA binding protein